MAYGSSWRRNNDIGKNLNAGHFKIKFEVFFNYNYETTSNFTKQYIDNNDMDTKQHYINLDSKWPRGPFGVNTGVKTLSEAFGDGL